MSCSSKNAQGDMDAEQTNLSLLEFKPEPAGIDLDSVKVQMVIGVILILATCFASCWAVFQSHIYRFEPPIRDIFIFLQHPWGVMELFSHQYSLWHVVPLLSISFDYLLWHGNPYCFLLINILLLAGSSIFVSLIVLEITGHAGNRLGAAPAIWSGLLFSVYPLHFSSIPLVEGRFTLLGNFFYLMSVFCYLRFLTVREQTFLNISLLSFLLSLLTYQRALALPLVVTLYAFLFQGSFGLSGSQWSKRTRSVLGFWLLLAIAVIANHLTDKWFPHGPIYTLAHLAWTNGFLISGDLDNLALPMSGNNSNFVPLLISYVLGLICLSLRILNSAIQPRLFIFLLVWILSIIVWFPTLNDLILNTNLVLAAAPFSILIVTTVTPALDHIKRKPGKLISIVATFTLLAIFLIWSTVFQSNFLMMLEFPH